MQTMIQGRANMNAWTTGSMLRKLQKQTKCAFCMTLVCSPVCLFSISPLLTSDNLRLTMSFVIMRIILNSRLSYTRNRL